MRRSGVSSVSRVVQYDTVISDWLHALRDAPHVQVVPKTKYPRQMHVMHASADCPIVRTPLDAWSGCSYIRYMCSFCEEPLPFDEPFNVYYNQTLTLPVIVACGLCSKDIK